MSTVINTGLTTAGLRSTFFERLNSTPARWQEWCTQVPSTLPIETYKWLGTVANPREWGTGRIAKGLRTESYTLENLEYESTIEVDRKEIEDDQTGQIRLRVQDMATRAQQYKDYLLAQLLITGDESGQNSYDGVSFFNDTHVSGASGNQDNLLTFEVASTDITQPTATEFKTAVQLAATAMMNFKDDQGMPLHMDANGLTLVCAPNLYFAALEAMTASVINNTSNVNAGLAQVVSFPFLSVNPGEWFLLKVGTSAVNPFIMQIKEPLEFVAIDSPSSEHVFKTNKYLYGTRERFRVGYGMWQNAVKMTFTT